MERSKRGLVQETGGPAIEAQMLAEYSRPDLIAEYSVTSRKRKEELIRARQEMLRGNMAVSLLVEPHHEADQT